ncbi:uncharacterized protein LOC111306777 [Durio zibethinus]|uniref:Uncharacterized protein LOC111306777 n=1 Tax=Durio zibethinus TaxID=66656 RepID=A0A6P6A6M5_DURZI|nr:uncharacterized protein LOC111306777 [Durio zibethinus]
MEMAATQRCPCSSFIFFTQQQKTNLHNLIHFPFCSLSHPHLRRRFSSYAARDSSSTSRRRRSSSKWDSNAETIRAKGFNTQNDDDGDEDDDYDEETASSGILDEAIDTIWILKVFKSFGWTLPPILLSLLFATGPKAFLMALSLPLGQLAITLAYEKLLGRSQSKQKRKARVRKKTKSTSRSTLKKVKMEEEVQQDQKSRKGTKDYQSWVVTDDGSVNEGGTSLGGWDEHELDGMGINENVINNGKWLKKDNKGEGQVEYERKWK